ncbi:MAG: glycosyltransferase family 4 protein [Pseudomonadota bacterium]
MHILYFHQHFSTPQGATGIRSYEMARAALGAGHRVTMVCGSYRLGQTGLTGAFRRGRRTGQVDGIDVIEFDLSYSNADGFLKRSVQFVKFALSGIWLALTRSYDVVFATTTPLTAGLPGIAARWLRGKTFVFEVRDLWPELPREMGVIANPIALGLMSFLEWASYRSAHRCIGLSPGIVQGIKRRGVDEWRITMVPNGCDLNRFAESDTGDVRPGGASKDALVAVFTGTHGVANGLDAVLDAAALLKARGREDIAIVLVGDGKEKPQLEARADHERLSNVRFMAPVNKAALAKIMASADLGIQCLANVPAFYFGTSPNKFFDYIAAGLPVLNNYPGWLAKMIAEENCGFAVPPDDPAAFADALETAADDRAALPAMGANARRLAERSFDRRHLARQWCLWVTEGRHLEAGG